MIKKNRNKAYCEIEINFGALLLLILLACCIYCATSIQDSHKICTPNGVSLYMPFGSNEGYTLTNKTCTPQKVRLYRNNECLIYTIDANSRYYIPANVVFDRIESEPIIK